MSQSAVRVEIHVPATVYFMHYTRRLPSILCAAYRRGGFTLRFGACRFLVCSFFTVPPPCRGREKVMFSP